MLLRLRKYSRKRETPTAVMRSDILGADRSGLYAIFSTRRPRRAVAAMVIEEDEVEGQMPFGYAVIGDEGAEHEDVAVGEIDEPQHPVDHGVAQGDERVDSAEL